MTTKRRIERKLKTLEEAAAAESENEKERLEIHPALLLCKPEPELTDLLRSRGFVVEREEQIHGNGTEDVVLHTTPSVRDVFQEVSWHHAGPTAVPDDVRIVWEDDYLEQVLADAEYPTEYGEPEVPAAPFVVDEGDGWQAVVPSDRVVTQMVHRRCGAEYHGLDILGPVELPVADADEYDLVEVDADPDEDRQPGLPDV